MRSWTIWTVGLLLLAFTAGCPFTAKVPLCEPERHSLDGRLFGVWSSHSGEGDSLQIRVIPFNDAEYYIEFRERDHAPSRYRAFGCKVNGQPFLNINELRADGAVDEYCFARYGFPADGELSLRFVGEKIVPKALGEKRASLVAFLRAHLNDPQLDDGDSALLLRREKADGLKE